MKQLYVDSVHFYKYTYFIESLWVERFVWKKPIADWFVERTGTLPRIDTVTQTVILPLDIAVEFYFVWS